MRIGFIGLGIMGSRMAANLLSNNYEVAVYNRTESKLLELTEKGAIKADNPASLAKNADVIITMVSDPQAIKDIAYGEKGFLDNAGKNSLWINCTTINPSAAETFHFAAQLKGLRYLDAPVAGTKKPAENAELVFLVGGNNNDLEEVRPLLHCMGKKVIHAGENAKGSSLKMVFNLMLGNAMNAFAEAINLGESLGLSKNTLFNTILGGPVAAPFLSGKQEKIEENNYQADFPLQWMNKDLELVSHTAYEAGVALPGTNSVKEAYALAKKYGMGENDFSAIYKFLKGDG